MIVYFFDAMLITKLFLNSYTYVINSQLVGNSLNSPDEIRTFEKGKIQTVTLADNGVTRKVRVGPSEID
jgi:hypothetical protein